jgi:hypothetical protein
MPARVELFLRSPVPKVTTVIEGAVHTGAPFFAFGKR